MNSTPVDGVHDHLLRETQSVPNSISARFSFRSEVTITVPLWFALVVCFATLMMVLLGLGFLYAVILMEPAIISIDEILSRTDTVVKSMVTSSVGAIAHGDELVRWAWFAFNYRV
jgi:hypothetical protein